MNGPLCSWTTTTDGQTKVSYTTPFFFIPVFSRGRVRAAPTMQDTDLKKKTWLCSPPFLRSRDMQVEKKEMGGREADICSYVSFCVSSTPMRVIRSEKKMIYVCRYTSCSPKSLCLMRCSCCYWLCATYQPIICSHTLFPRLFFCSACLFAFLAWENERGERENERERERAVDDNRMVSVLVFESTKRSALIFIFCCCPQWAE